MQEIKIDVHKIKTIFHVSDIHIRNLKRHKEYKVVFDRLFDEIRTNKKDSIILVAGDIAHAKTDMSPELIHMITVFLKNLSDLCPTFVIAGNHDCNLNNLDRLDALEPIIEALDYHNLFYLKQSGVFKISNIDLYVYSVFDDIKKYEKIKKSDNEYQVALYHGAIRSAVSDSGLKLESKITKRFFDGFDIVALGDIHKFQILQEFKDSDQLSKKRPGMAYSSSLIQQNHGEDYKNHGFIKWNLQTRKPEFIRIENDYGFYTLRVKNSKIPDVNDLPKFPRLRVEVENTPLTELKEILSKIRLKYNVKDIVVNSIDQELNLNRSKIHSYESIGNIYDITYQNNLIEQFLLNLYNDITPNEIERVKGINVELNRKINSQDFRFGSNWKLKSLKFSNMFSFGEDNFVNFSKLSGINGLFAPNTAGKSSLIDVLLFSLFDKTSRSTKTIDILNVNKEEFYCLVNFEINGVDHFIEKVGIKTKQNYKDAVKVNTDFWFIDPITEEKRMLNGDQRRSTNQIIFEKIGTYENMVLTNVSLQGNNGGIITKSQSERNTLMSDFVGIDIFGQLYELGNNENKNTNAILKEFTKQDLHLDLKKIEEVLITDKKDLELLNLNLIGLKTKRETANSEILELTKQLTRTTGLFDIHSLEEQREELIETISQLETQIQENEKTVKLINKGAESLFKKLEFLKPEETLTEYKKLEQLRIHQDDLLLQKKNNEIELKYQEEKLKKLEKVEYDENCKFCMNNIFVKDAIATKELNKTTKEIQKSIQTELDEIEKEISSKSDVVERMNKIKIIYSDKEELKSMQEIAKRSLDSNIEKLELNNRLLNENRTNIELYHTNAVDIELNKDIQLKIDGLKSDFLEIESKIDIISKDITRKHSKISVSANQKKTIEQQIRKVKEYEHRQKALQYYLKAYHRTGIPYDLIKRIIPSVESEANAILDQLSDFNILIDLDDVHIDMYIVYKTGAWSLTLTSGMEKFISSIALRVALNKITKISKPNFFIVDEGWANLDSDNLNQLYILFNYLKNQYDFTLIVSHLDAMRDVIDKLIDIKKADGYSRIYSE